MFEVKVITKFCAAHFLKNYKGKCENLHGHNWKVEAVVSSDELDQTGMVMDFKDLKSFLNEITEEFDHKSLNDLKWFKDTNTTSEIIAKTIFLELEEKINKHSARLLVKEVAVWEQENSCAVYRKTQKQ